MRWKNLVVLIGSLLVYALIAEVVYRVVIDDGMTYEIEMWKYAKHVKQRSENPDIGHRHRPNAQATLMGVDVRTDRNGFRNAELPAEAPTGTARIAFVGDSITMGWGVAERETFSHRVIDMLRAQGRNVDGFNSGVGNLNTAQELALHEAAGAALKPDIVALYYFINDAEPTQKYGEVGWLDWHSELWVVVKYQIDTLLRFTGGRVDWKDYYRNLYEPGQAGWLKTQQELARFAKVTAAERSQLVVFNVPELRELKPYPFSDVTAQVRSVVEKTGAPFVDLLPAVENEDPASLWVTVPDPHPNGKANGLFARAIVENLTPYLDRLCTTQGKGCKAGAGSTSTKQ